MSDERISMEETQTLIEAEMEETLQVALLQFAEAYEMEDKGDAWLDEEPRYHFWKGIDELFSATHHAKNEQPAKMQARLADAINHLMMGSWLAWEEAALPDEIPEND